MHDKILALAVLTNAACFAQTEMSYAAADCKPKPACNFCDTPPLRCLNYENDLFLDADFIYWIAKQEGNDFATTGAAITVPGTTDPNTGLVASSVGSGGQVFAPNTQIKPGFKASLGCDLRHDRWQVFAEYTFLFSEGDRSVTSGQLNTSILPIFSYTPNHSILSTTTFAASTGATGYVSEANSKWWLHFNNGTLEFKKDFPLTRCLSFNPHFGLQGTWQRQKFRTNYMVRSFTALHPGLGSNKVIFKQDFWGIGIRVGADTNWRISEHFGLYALSAVSLLWGEFKARGLSYDTNVAAGYSDVLIANQYNKVFDVSPVLQLGTGLQFDWITCKGRRFLIQAGWEEQVWFFQNQHSSVIADTSLSLQGLTAKMRVDF